MKQIKTKKHNISTVAALLTFCVFAVCVVSVLLSGAKAYRALTVDNSDNFTLRTCSGYLSTRMHQAESPDSVKTGAFGDGDCLLISEDIDGSEYVTRIYCYEGWLRELFTLADGNFEPADGEKVLEASDLHVSLEDGLLDVSVTDAADHNINMVLSIRGGRNEQE